MNNPRSADDQDLRDMAVKRLKKRREFRGNVATFVMVNGALWLIWGLTGAHTNHDGVPWPAWITGFWALILILQAWHLYSDRPISETEIQSEMVRMDRT
jgi:2TM domain